MVTHDTNIGDKQVRAALGRGAMNAHRQLDNPVCEVFAMNEPKVHAIDPTNVPTGSTGLAEKACMDPEASKGVKRSFTE